MSLPQTRWGIVMKFSVVRQPRARPFAAWTSELMASRDRRNAGAARSRVNPSHPAVAVCVNGR